MKSPIFFNKNMIHLYREGLERAAVSQGMGEGGGTVGVGVAGA